MPDSPVPGTGQVPPGAQSPDGNGQVPPTSQDATSANGDNAPGESPLTESQLRDINEKLRKENAKARVDAKRLAELEAKEAAAAEAELTEKQRSDKKIADLQTKYEDLQRQAQERVVRSDIRHAADKFGIKPELAYRILKYEDIAFNDDGDPTNISALLKAALEDLAPGLLGQQQPAPAGAANNGFSSGIPQTGATNPPRGTQRVGANGVFSRDEIVRSVNDPRLWKRGG